MRVLALTPTARLESGTTEFLLSTRLRVQRGEVEGVSSFDILLTTDNPHPALPVQEGGDGGRANILHNYQKGRAVALAGGYDAVLVVESDIIPPPDALDKLAALLRDRADVAYGLYLFRPHDERRMEDKRYVWTVNVYERPKGGTKTMKPGSCLNTGSSVSLKGRYSQALRDRIVPCSGGGLGIVLARREVFERVEFRTKGRDGAHCDTYWNTDVWRAGFEQWADMSVVCAHVTPSGKTLWPPETTPWF